MKKGTSEGLYLDQDSCICSNLQRKHDYKGEIKVLVREEYRNTLHVQMYRLKVTTAQKK
jgi:hypothetical protein